MSRMPRMVTMAERRAVLRASPDRISNHREQFQFAWIHAVAAACGAKVLQYSFDDGLDCVLEQRNAQHTAFRNGLAKISFQLKTTTTPANSRSLVVRVARGRLAEYAEPDSPGQIPNVLVGMHVHKEQYDWLRGTNFCLALRGRSVWMNPAGRPVSAGDASDMLDVPIPVADHHFDDVTLARMFAIVGKGGVLS